ncbi:MAG TPA: MarR family transcriptional regulator [Burkholderiaceae bacterium]|nr:MarR family transcriptional regulator [Burkholderiaceae bacterium]
MTDQALLAPRSLDDLLMYRLARVVRASGGMVTRLLEGGFGITRREWGVVASLYPLQDIISSALAERLQLDRVRTSRTLQGLVTKGLVACRRDQADKRIVHVSLTPPGRRLYEQLFPRIAQLNTELLAALEPAHVDVLALCLQQLESQGRAMSAMGRVTDKADRRAGAGRRRFALPVDPV